MKKITYGNIDNDVVETIISMSIELNSVIEEYEGSLLTNYIVYNDRKISLGRAKGREYIIAKEKYLNEWSSCYDVIFTDEEKEVDEFRNLMTE